MFGPIIGGVIAAAGSIAAAGAATSVIRGMVRSVGHLVEGDPRQSLRAIGNGILEPLAVTANQFVNLGVDTINVVAYTGLQVVGVVRGSGGELMEHISSEGFDSTLAAIIVASSMPDTSALEPARTAGVEAPPSGASGTTAGVRGTAAA